MRVLFPPDSGRTFAKKKVWSLIRPSQRRFWQNLKVNRQEQSPPTRIDGVEHTHANTDDGAVVVPTFIENCQIFFEGQCENTFINMYAADFHPQRRKGK